jgi:hypothetical protein
MEKLIHVRFSPDGSVAEIGERPAGITPQEWFDHLTRTVGNTYQTFAGGRGIFRVASGDLDALKGALAS